MCFQYVQKKHEDYKENKEDTVWSMEKFNDYINERVAPERDLEENWVQTTLDVSTSDPTFARIYWKVD